ncbi:MAG TPA: hypothetical protein PLV52_05340, partial [Candidatus Omnitrophota bacterium]|nr:hypothetical protein [Candidatus Omnitrophota bacterium]
AVKLELAGPVDTNSYEVLLELFAQSGYWRNIPYLTKDEDKNIFKYLPKNLPKNYEEEIRMHREFVKLVLSAA